MWDGIEAFVLRLLPMCFLKLSTTFWRPHACTNCMKSQEHDKILSKMPHRPFQLPVLKKKDMTIEEMRVYEGTGPEGRVLIALNGKIVYVTRGPRGGIVALLLLLLME